MVRKVLKPIITGIAWALGILTVVVGYLLAYAAYIALFIGVPTVVILVILHAFGVV